MTKVRTDLGYDPRHWTSGDGHLHVSVPTEIPETWKQKYTDRPLTYVSGLYTIVRKTYGTKYSYAVQRDGVELPCGGLYSRLKDAKARAVKNARGEDRVNVA